MGMGKRAGQTADKGSYSSVSMVESSGGYMVLVVPGPKQLRCDMVDSSKSCF